MGAITPQAIVSAWWQKANTRALVLILTALAMLDSGYTVMWIGQRGLAGEINPLIRMFFDAGLAPAWLVGNIVATFLGAAFLASCIVILPIQGRAYPVLGISLLAALKVVLGLYHLIQFYGTLEVTWILWFTAVAAFLATRKSMREGRLIDWGMVSHSLHELRDELAVLMLVVRAPKARTASLGSDTPARQPASTGTGERRSALKNWRLLFWIGVIVLTPIAGLSLVQIVLQVSGVLELPRWMRGLGMVSEEQGRLFFVALITILLTIAVLIYSIVAVFEVLSDETTKKRRGSKRRRRSDKVLTLLVLVSLTLTISSVCLSVAVATVQAQTGSSVGVSNNLPSEIVAAADSKGRIHAAWVEWAGESFKVKDASLWYSKYDSETTVGSTGRLIDRSSSIHSLDITVDGFDNAHLVWVRQSTNMTVTRDGSGITVDELCYLSMYPNGTALRSPGRLLGPRTDRIWASITSGRQTGLYLAWTEASQGTTRGVESAAYYSRLSENDGIVDGSGLLVARMTGAARMMRASLSTDHSDLHLAWVQDIPAQGTSRIVYSKVDLSHNISKTVNVEDVNGTITKLTLAQTAGGQVVMGWVCQDSKRGEPIAGVTRVSQEGRAESTWIETPSHRLSQLESLVVDSQGNLHILWADLSEDVRAAPKSIPVSRASFYYAKYTSNGESTEEKRETIYLPAIAAFALTNGQLYVVSPMGMLAIARPLLIGNPVTVAVALLAFVSAASAMSTEPGTYLVARTVKPLMRRGSNSLRTKILRKVRGHPGITLSDLKTLTHSNILEVVWHLRMLESSGLIRSLREGPRQRFYRITPKDPDVPPMGETRRAIISVVERDPGMTEGQIARTLGLSQQLTNYHLRLLNEAKLLSRFQAAGKTSYHVNEQYRKRVYSSTGE
jgi:DNA-binding transcriptional ArsR family regulator